MNRALCAVALAALACREPTSPSRAGIYQFSSGGDVFRWPVDRLPVRFYAQPKGNLRFLTQRAIDAWAGLFLYGEFTGEMVGDSSAADVIVHADSAPDVPPDQGPPVYACEGNVHSPGSPPGTVTWDASTKAIDGPLHLDVRILGAYSTEQVAACLRRTMIHEVGHALGLFQHSPNAEDIMYASANSGPLVVLPSERDRRTVEVLYHTQATVFPPPP